MDLLVLNDSLDVVAIVDSYKSLIWTGRYQECGDFELYIAMSDDLLTYIRQDWYLWNKESDYVMIIEKIQITTDAEEGKQAIISGRSLESILDRRIVWGLKTLSGNLQNGIETLINENIINPSKPERKIANFVFEASTDPKISGLTIDTQYTGDNLYDIVTTICVERKIGFKISLNDQKQFVFKLYAGTDRTYDQTANPYVIFSPNFDNIVNSNYVEEKTDLKNVTLVGGEGEGAERRYTAVGNVSGLNRRETFTDARDISSDSDEDISSLFVFTEFSSQVFDNVTKNYVTDSRFNSSTADISAYVGRRISIKIPKYTNPSGAISNYATVLLDESKAYISTLKVWEKDGDTANKGSLESYEFLIPNNAKYIYSSMFSQSAINSDVYHGEATDFECKTIQVSNAEYIAQLRQRGKETLAETLKVVSFDGEVDPYSMFKFGKDYFVGDIVEVSDEYGHETKSMIVEVIISENEEGHTIYPTFSTIEADYLPSGYLELTYIESNGGQYIDTGFKPNQDTRVIFVFEAVDLSQNKWYFGSRSGSGMGDSFSCFFGAEIQTEYGDNTISTGQIPSGIMTIDKNKSITTINEKTFANPSATFTGTNNIFLFAGNSGGTALYPSSIRLYSCQVYDGNILIRDFVPCKNEMDEIGLYDLVDGVFYSNAGTGSFAVG